MTQSTLDAQDRSRFQWPEPLIIDLVRGVYDGNCDIARLHAKALRQQFDGAVRHAAAVRLDLIAACAARGIQMSVIRDADDCVIAELTHLVAMRFRNSPRDGLQVLDALKVMRRSLAVPTATTPQFKVKWPDPARVPRPQMALASAH